MLRSTISFVLADFCLTSIFYFYFLKTFGSLANSLLKLIEKENIINYNNFWIMRGQSYSSRKTEQQNIKKDITVQKFNNEYFYSY